MKRINEILTAGRRLGMPLAMMALLGSCSMFHDDLPDCATRPNTRATVNFVYDYNTSETDVFAEAVGAVTLYVYDEAGNLVLRQEHTVDGQGINAQGYSMPLELPAGKYTLYASARENTAGYEASLQTQGAKFRRVGDQPGNAMTDLIYTLDNQQGVVTHQNLALEHFWLTREAVPFEMTVAPMPAEGDPQPEDVVLSVTMPLQRVTNNINLTIMREWVTRAEGDPFLPEDYDVRITTVEAHDQLDLLGRPLDSGHKLTYTPHAVTASTADDGKPCLVANLATSRIMHEADASKHMLLTITSRVSGETFSWDLPSLLAKGREADAYAPKGWSEQEYLDRQTDYDLKVVFSQKDDTWRYVEVGVQLLNWTKRIQNVTL